MTFFNEKLEKVKTFRLVRLFEIIGRGIYAVYLIKTVFVDHMYMEQENLEIGCVGSDHLLQSPFESSFAAYRRVGLPFDRRFIHSHHHSCRLPLHLFFFFSKYLTLEQVLFMFKTNDLVRRWTTRLWVVRLVYRAYFTKQSHEPAIVRFFFMLRGVGPTTTFLKTIFFKTTLSDNHSQQALQ